jgi:hypothetical protein
MYSQVHANRVLYKTNPEPGHRYKQIGVVEKETFQFYIYEGDVILTDPEFLAYSSDAVAELHPSLQSAMTEVEVEQRDSIAAGWIPLEPRQVA